MCVLKGVIILEGQWRNKLKHYEKSKVKYDLVLLHISYRDLRNTFKADFSIALTMEIYFSKSYM